MKPTSDASNKDRYPRPQEYGGRLIRETLRALRAAKLSPPLSAHILIACSGGSDSTALAHLIAKYGRRLGGRVRLIHFNHGWRGEAALADECFVRDLARSLSVGFESQALKREDYIQTGDSWEAASREVRMEFFERLAKSQSAPKKAIVLTAHHQDDQAETVLWRILSGAKRDQWRGILPRHGSVYRPWLNVPKAWILGYLKEEALSACNDSTNLDPRFLRTRVRHEILPILQKNFPAVRRILSDIAVCEQRKLASRPQKGAK